MSNESFYKRAEINDLADGKIQAKLVHAFRNYISPGIYRKVTGRADTGSGQSRRKGCPSRDAVARNEATWQSHAPDEAL
jgi:hypothetical protein